MKHIRCRPPRLRRFANYEQIEEHAKWPGKWRCDYCLTVLDNFLALAKHFVSQHRSEAEATGGFKGTYLGETDESGRPN